MKSTILSVFTLVGVALAASSVPQAQATDINLGTNECQPISVITPNAIFHSATSTANLGDGLYYVTCNLPRSPLPAGATSGGFYVDGDNFGGAQTVCLIWSYDYTGTYLGSSAFTATAAQFDQFVSLPAAQLPTYAYTYLECSLARNGLSQIRGVTSLQ